VSGTIYKRGKNWTIGYTVDGVQKIEATGSNNKRVAQKILDIRLAEIIEGRFRLLKSNAPRLEKFSQEFLDTIHVEKTKKRYTSSVVNLRMHFGDADSRTSTRSASMNSRKCGLQMGFAPQL